MAPTGDQAHKRVYRRLALVALSAAVPAVAGRDHRGGTRLGSPAALIDHTTTRPSKQGRKKEDKEQVLISVVLPHFNINPQQ